MQVSKRQTYKKQVEYSITGLTKKEARLILMACDIAGTKTAKTVKRIAGPANLAKSELLSANKERARNPLMAYFVEVTMFYNRICRQILEA